MRWHIEEKTPLPVLRTAHWLTKFSRGYCGLDSIAQFQPHAEGSRYR